MTRFVVRPTDGGNVPGFSVVDTNREDEKGRQIGRGLREWIAKPLAEMLNQVHWLRCDEPAGSNEDILAVFAACADAHDDYLSDEEKRANREAREKEQA